MHLFRQCERETLRARHTSVKRLVVRGSKPVTNNCERSGRKGRVSRKVERRETGPVVGLPFPNPVRAAARRRARRKKRVRSVGSREGFQKQESPVKAFVPVPDQTRFYWEYSKYDSERVVYCAMNGHGCVSSCKGNAESYPCCKYEHIRLLQRRSRSKVYVRRGANRGEKRRNWFADRVVKNIPRWLKSDVDKRTLSRVKNLWMNTHARLPPSAFYSGLAEAVGRKSVEKYSKFNTYVDRHITRKVPGGLPWSAPMWRHPQRSRGNHTQYSIKVGMVCIGTSHNPLGKLRKIRTPRKRFSKDSV